MRRAKIHLIIISSLICLLGSCTLRDLTYDYHPYFTLELSVDWSGFAGETPTGMTAMFFKEDGSGPTVELTNSVYSTKVLLRKGVYNIIVFNQSVTEFGSLEFSGMNLHHTAQVRLAEEKSSWYVCEEGEKLAKQPEPFAVASYEGFEVTQEMIDAERIELGLLEEGKEGRPEAPERKLELKPSGVIAMGDVSIRVDGIHNVRAMRGSIKGVAGNVFLFSRTAGDDDVVHLLENWSKSVDEDDYRLGFIRSHFDTFGHKGMVHTKAGESPWDGVKLEIKLLLVDNKTVKSFIFNVKDYVTVENVDGRIRVDIKVDSPEGEAAPIVLEDVEPETGTGGGGGFDVKVDDWGDEVGVDVIV